MRSSLRVSSQSWIARSEARQDVSEPGSIGLALEKERLERLARELKAERLRLTKLAREELRIIDHGKIPDAGPEASDADPSDDKPHREPLTLEHDPTD